MEKIKRKIPYRQGIWEVDFFYFPEAVKEKEERPFYPFTSELGINLRRVKKLKMLEDAKASMFKFTAGEKRDVI